MGDKKVTKMLIKVDLQCSKCRKKIKKVLCKFNEIRDQVYDEKANTVTITVFCCSPEKIKEKIYCKGGDAVLSIETIPDKPKEPEKKKETEKPKEKVVVIFQPPIETKPKPKPDPIPIHKPPPPGPEPKPPKPICICPGYPAMVYAPGFWGCPCSHGYGVGVPPCYGGYPRPPAMCSDGCGRPASACSDGCGRPASACSDGCGRPAYACQGDYFSDENSSGCIVM